jgi:hypothetical protein
VHAAGEIGARHFSKLLFHLNCMMRHSVLLILQGLQVRRGGGRLSFIRVF